MLLTIERSPHLQQLCRKRRWRDTLSVVETIKKEVAAVDPPDAMELPRLLGMYCVRAGVLSMHVCLVVCNDECTYECVTILCEEMRVHLARDG